MTGPQTSDIVFTERAASKARELIAEESNPDLKLRVYVAGGGCSGFQYGFTFDESLQDGDTEVSNDGVTLLVDPMIELVLGRSPPEQPLLANLINRVKLFCTTYDPARDGYYFDYSLFVGMFIGATIIGIAGAVVVRGLRNGSRPT